MRKFLFIFFGVFIFGCNANESFVDPLRPEFEDIAFEVVQKKLVINPDLPEHLQNLLSQWFDNRVKISGFEGEMEFIVTDFNQEISSINNGRRVDVSLSFNLHLHKPTLSQTKLIEGNISSFGTLTGDFSLNELDILIQNTQSDLIIRLSKDLKSKI